MKTASQGKDRKRQEEDRKEIQQLRQQLQELLQDNTVRKSRYSEVLSGPRDRSEAIRNTNEKSFSIKVGKLSEIWSERIRHLSLCHLDEQRGLVSIKAPDAGFIFWDGKIIWNLVTLVTVHDVECTQ